MRIYFAIGGIRVPELPVLCTSTSFGFCSIPNSSGGGMLTDNRPGWSAEHTHATLPEILDGLLQFRLAVHHEGAIPGDGFTDRFTRN